MLLKLNNGQIRMIDATSNEGVSTYRWSSLRKCYSFYDKIVYRALRFKRTNKMLQSLEEFIKKILKKKYKLNPLRLFQKYSIEDSIANVEKKNGYFCSELIASIYKFLGFLRRDIKSSQYLPGNFSSEYNLELLNGAVLDDEYLIEFNKP